jgi:hypothetical protein
MDNVFEQQKEDLHKQLDVLQHELTSAQNELSSWEEYDMRREDGSGAQDRRHEERGQNLRDRVWELNQKVEKQRKLIEGLELR